ncbi:MAG: pentapeptide repeat-containing protein, partial [Planctomycetes bacterium]|nr:pentapeptide repeat-containing protein [Planctomycetota bacterium]
MLLRLRFRLLFSRRSFQFECQSKRNSHRKKLVANEKLLKLVRQGRGAFVKWRAKHAKVILDLMDADLSGIDLRGANLRRADLIGIDLTDANLANAALTGADLTRSKLGQIKLQRADLSNALLAFADLSGADLT